MVHNKLYAKGEVVNILCFAGRIFSATIAQFCSCCEQAAINSNE